MPCRFNVVVEKRMMRVVVGLMDPEMVIIIVTISEVVYLMEIIFKILRVLKKVKLSNII